VIQFFMLIVLFVIGAVSALFAYLYLREGNEKAAVISGVLSLLSWWAISDIAAPVLLAIGNL
jgi:hypothetical protein